MSDVVELLVGSRACLFEVERDEARVRPVRGARRSAATPSKLRAATGWAPEIPLEQTLADTLEAPRGSRGGASRERAPRADHRDHRPGRLVPRRAPAGEGLRRLRHDPARLDRERRADRAPRRPGVR